MQSRSLSFRACLGGLRSSSAAEDGVKPFSAIPGPKPLPFVGNTIAMAVNSNRYTAFHEECFKEYGDIFKLKLLSK